MSERPESISSRNESRFSVLPRLWRKHRRERQQVSPVEGGLLHVGLVSPPLVHPEVEEAHDLRVGDSEKQLLSEVLVGEEIGELR